MLIKCPECELQVSDKAMFCPHCGYPLKYQSKSTVKRSNKRRRLPNGFGQISEIKNRNLRKPFRAMVTVGKNEYGRPICKPLKPESYFTSYNDAYAALVEYNKNPYDLGEAITMKELYERWSKEYIPTLKSDSSIRALERAWKYCSSVYSVRVLDIRTRHIKQCIYNGTAPIKNEQKSAGPAMQMRIKSLFNQILDYAVEYELVNKNYARTFKLSSETDQATKKSHLAFTDEEISVLWNHVNDKKYVDIIVIQCYSGWRPQELGLIELKNVDLENDTFTGGMKTKAGKDRIVPIHPRIKQLVVNRYNEAKELGSEYLFNCVNINATKKDTQFTYERYKTQFNTICSDLHLNPDHRPHDGRKHFVTMAKKYGVDEYAIKYIVGHTISDITEKVYTQRDVDWLKEEMKKIK